MIEAKCPECGQIQKLDDKAEKYIKISSDNPKMISHYCNNCSGYTIEMKDIIDSKDPVHHPDHYNKGIEVIKFTNSWNCNFNIGSAIKYLMRAGLKDPEKHKEDLEKAKQYIDFEIERLQE